MKDGTDRRYPEPDGFQLKMKAGDCFIYPLIIQNTGKTYIVGELLGRCEDEELCKVRVFDGGDDVAPLSLMIPIPREDFDRLREARWDDTLCAEIYAEALLRFEDKCDVTA
jgi:hypothetical protein